MTWASDITLLNAAINTTVTYCRARDIGNVPYDEVLKLKTLAEAALVAAAVPLSASPVLPKLRHGI